MTEAIVLNGEMITVLVILGFTIFLFVSEVVRVDVAAVLIMVILGATSLLPNYDGLVPVEHLFDGFSSNAVMSIVAVMIIGAGLDKTGIMSHLASKILKWGGKTESRIITIVCTTVAAVSSFMQNIGAAALYLPVVNRIARRGNIPISRLLMPMGFCAILGGTMTMIGSSPLILLNDLILTSNRTLPADIEQMSTFSLFSVFPIGAILICVGIVYFIVIGRWVLPVVKDKPGDAGSTLTYFREVYGIEGEVYELIAQPDSELVGKTVDDIESAGRAGWIIAMRNGNDARITPHGDTEIIVGSEFAIMGRQKAIEEFANEYGLHIKSEMDSFADMLSATSAGIAEIVIAPDSNLKGKSLREVGLRRRYGATVLAVFRINEVIDEDLSDLVFQSGDTLVVHSRWRDLAPIAKDKDFVVVTDFPREDIRPRKLKYAITFFALTLSLILFTDIRLSLGLMVGAVGMIVSGVIKMEEAYQAVGWQSVFLLASLMPLGLAVDSTGTAAWIAQQTLLVMGDIPAWGIQAVIAVLATVFTLVMSNVGATVLLVPLAINIAIAVDANPAIFALTVALATSNSFLIPTHQVNALIMGPGGYQVADFMRAGGIMTVLFLVVMLAMMNIIF